MKIKVKPSTFEEVEILPPIPKMKTKKPSKLLWSLIRVISLPELWSCKFSFDKSDLKRAGKGPYLILMNHRKHIHQLLLSCQTQLQLIS